MKKYFSKVSKETEVIILNENETLPAGYFPVAGCFIRGKEVQIAIPEKVVFENRELAQKLTDEAGNELMKMISL